MVKHSVFEFQFVIWKIIHLLYMQGRSIWDCFLSTRIGLDRVLLGGIGAHSFPFIGDPTTEIDGTDYLVLAELIALSIEMFGNYLAKCYFNILRSSDLFILSLILTWFLAIASSRSRIVWAWSFRVLLKLRR